MFSLFLKPKLLLLFFIVVGVVLSFVFAPQIAIFIALSVVCFLAVFFLQRLRMPFDITPVFVLSLLVCREFGLLWSFLFVIVAGVVPTFIGGGSFDVGSLLYMSAHALALFAATLLLGFPFFFSSLALLVGYHMISFFIGMLISQNRAKEFVNLAIKLAVDTAYVALISRFLFLVP